MSYTRPTETEVARRRADLAPFDGWNERAFCQIAAWLGVPASYLDLGSGTGAMVNMARKIGVDAYGVDVINGPEHWFIAHDLATPIQLLRDSTTGEQLFVETDAAFDWNTAPVQPVRFDLVTCLEVAEHLPLDAHSVLADTIARHIAPGGRLIFSAAPPGQAGEHHVGCRPPREWLSLMHERGVSYRADYTRQLAHLIAWVSGPAAHWLAANLMVFDTWDGQLMQEVG